MEFDKKVEELVTITDTVPDLKTIARAQLCCVAYSPKSIIQTVDGDP